jgi:tetratricopeptide (TPR) repeat protein
MPNGTYSCYWAHWVLLFCCLNLSAECEAQVLVRVPVEQSPMNLEQSKWSGALAYAWEQVAMLESDDALQVADIRVRVVEGLIGLGEIEQAVAAADRLTGLAHYQMLARAAAAVEGAEQKRLRAKAEKGFDFLSQRNQEQLVSDVVVLAVPQGWESVTEVLGRCLDVEARLLAFGRVAARVAGKDKVMFERCIKLIEDQSKGLNRLGRRYAALAMTEAVEGWVQRRETVELEEDERWYEIALSASDAAVGTPNAEEIYARLALVLIGAGKLEQGLTLFEKARLPFKQTRGATPERMELMGTVIQVAKVLGEGAFSGEWVEQVMAEAELADEEWKWEVLILAGRILQRCDEGELAMKCWRTAAQVAGKDPNTVVLSVCLGLLAMEAHELGLWRSMGWLLDWKDKVNGSEETLVEEPGC